MAGTLASRASTVVGGGIWVLMQLVLTLLALTIWVKFFELNPRPAQAFTGPSQPIPRLARKKPAAGKDASFVCWCAGRWSPLLKAEPSRSSSAAYFLPDSSFVAAVKRCISNVVSFDREKGKTPY